ncbi:MAG: hypothetical protein Q4E69_00915 [Bacilli bacterium]|nr:hypothetical protein [Bacilli bacterium]
MFDDWMEFKSIDGSKPAYDYIEPDVKEECPVCKRKLTAEGECPNCKIKVNLSEAAKTLIKKK